MKVKGKYIYDEKDYHHVFSSTYQKTNVNKIREELNLSEVKQGERSCLRCDTVFFSDDLKNKKLCVRCRGKRC